MLVLSSDEWPACFTMSHRNIQRWKCRCLCSCRPKHHLGVHPRLFWHLESQDPPAPGERTVWQHTTRRLGACPLPLLHILQALTLMLSCPHKQCHHSQGKHHRPMLLPQEVCKFLVTPCILAWHCFPVWCCSRTLLLVASSDITANIVLQRGLVYMQNPLRMHSTPCRLCLAIPVALAGLTAHPPLPLLVLATTAATVQLCSSCIMINLGCDSLFFFFCLHSAVTQQYSVTGCLQKMRPFKIRLHSTCPRR